RAGGSLRCRSVGQREDVALLTCVQVCMRCKAKCVSLVDRRPVRSGAADRDLVIDMKAPLRLYLAFDEWQVTEECLLPALPSAGKGGAPNMGIRTEERRGLHGPCPSWRGAPARHRRPVAALRTA